MTALPIGIVAGDTGHISHHNAMHALLNPVDAPFGVAPILVEPFYADKPVAGQAGRLFGAVDLGVLEFDDGAVWRDFVRDLELRSEQDPPGVRWQTNAAAGDLPDHMTFDGDGVPTNMGVSIANFPSIQGPWPSMVQLWDLNVDRSQSTALEIASAMRTTSGDVYLRQGLHVVAYAPQVAFGGDNSAALFLSTGAGSAIAAFKTHTLRPTGWTNYTGVSQAAVEIGNGDDFAAVKVIAGAFGGVEGSNGIIVNLEADVPMTGIVVEPNHFSGLPNDGFDDRPAFCVGRAQNGAGYASDRKMIIYMEGTVATWSGINILEQGSPNDGPYSHWRLFSELGTNVLKFRPDADSSKDALFLNPDGSANMGYLKIGGALSSIEFQDRTTGTSDVWNVYADQVGSLSLLRFYNGGVDRFRFHESGYMETTGNAVGYFAHSPDGTRYKLVPPNGGGAASWVAG